MNYKVCFNGLFYYVTKELSQDKVIFSSTNENEALQFCLECNQMIDGMKEV